MQSVNLNYKPSFGGITRYLQREIYDVAKAQKQLLTLPKSEFVGQLPNEILQDIIKKSKTSDEKREKILHIMNGFSNLSNFFATPKGINFKSSPPSFWTKIFSFLKPKDPLYKKFKMIYSKQDIDKILAIINMGAEQITKTFQDVGLLKTREKIKLEYLGKGCSGKALRMIFPKRTKYSSKVFKVFKKTEFERKLSTNEIFNIGSGFHEINSMIYIKNAHKGNGFKNSEYVEGYFASLKNKFMLLEDTYNYPKKENSDHFKIDHELNLMLWDKSTEGNVLNGRMVDYGYIMQIEKMPYFLKKNPHIRK